MAVTQKSTQLNLSLLRSPIFIIGAAHTGKSELAAQVILPDKPAVIIGAAALVDSEMVHRVAELKKLRPPIWETIEDVDSMTQIIREKQGRGMQQFLVDSLNQWIGGILHKNLKLRSMDQIEAIISQETKAFITLLRENTGRICVVSSEVAAGLSPARPVPRLFRHTVSRFNTQVAGVCATVIMVAAGIPLLLKGGPEVPRLSSISSNLLETKKNKGDP